ncbi:MAG: translation initiation factor IF-2 subunit alpha [Conexivisphaerales archaeon]
MSEQLPDIGEVVFATVTQITPYGAYVTLDEYSNHKGFLHISEVSTGWVRNIERFVKPGQKVVLKVIRVDQDRREVDLSLRQVTSEEKKEKLIQVKKEAKAKGILDLVKKSLNLQDDSEIRQKMIDEYGSLYDALEMIARKGEAELVKLSLDKRYQQTLLQVLQERFKLPLVEVKGMLEITSTKSDGVTVIKDSILKSVRQMPQEVQVEITYGGAPRYYVRLKAENFKVAERQLKTLTDSIAKYAGNMASVNFIREKS